MKCDQYWPTRGTETYGLIQVTLLDTVELATYSVRTFALYKVTWHVQWTVMVSGVYWSAEIFMCTSLCVYAWFWGHSLHMNMQLPLFVSQHDEKPHDNRFFYFFFLLFHTLLILPLRFKVIHPIIMLCLFFFIISCWIEKVYLINYIYIICQVQFIHRVCSQMFKYAHHELLLHILKIHCCDILYFCPQLSPTTFGAVKGS